MPVKYYVLPLIFYTHFFITFALVYFVLVLWHINPCRSFNANSLKYMNQIHDLQTYFANNIWKQAWAHFFHTVKWFHLISNNSVQYKYKVFVYTKSNVKTIPFQTILFSISTQFKC